MPSCDAEFRALLAFNYQLLPGFKPDQLKSLDGLPDEIKKGLRDKYEKQKQLYKDMPIRPTTGKIKP